MTENGGRVLVQCPRMLGGFWCSVLERWTGSGALHQNPSSLPTSFLYLSAKCRFLLIDITIFFNEKISKQFFGKTQL